VVKQVIYFGTEGVYFLSNILGHEKNASFTTTREIFIFNGI
jgi:hypothetical protein